MPSVIREVVFDCVDAKGVAEFWSGVLGWYVQAEEEGYYWMSPSGQDLPSELQLVFLPVTHAKARKNRLHIDVSPTGCTQEEELGRLLGLGARRVDVGQGEVSWVVLADIEGNEFCLLHTPVG